MAHMAPLAWVFCFFLFLFFVLCVMSKLRYYPLRPKFMVSSPRAPKVSAWQWSCS